MPASIFKISIKEGVRVSSFAMNHSFGNTVCTFIILSLGYRLKMLWINTSSVVAKMVKYQSFWNWAYQKFISKAVRDLGEFRIYTKCSISSSSPCPKPACVGFVDFDPKPFFRTYPFSWMNTSGHRKSLWRSWKPKVQAKGLRLAPEGME